MDSLSAVINAMFHDFPIADAYGMIVGTDNKSGFLSSLIALACAEEYGVKKAVAKSKVGELESELERRGYRKDNTVQLFMGLPMLFADDVLKRDSSGEACVEFKKLLRWREVVKCLGEDLFATSYLAEKDGTARKDFCWPNVIAHDKEALNDLLDEGLSDIHSHFGGSIDSFMFNWICLMNDVGGLYDKFESMQRTLNPIKVLKKDFSFKNLANWCRVAAAIRIYLYRVLFKGGLNKTDVMKSILKAINDNDAEEVTLLKVDIDTLRSEAKQTCDGVRLDYAIREELVTEVNERSPFCFYAGERQLEYAFYREYLAKGSKMKGMWVELFYLYELIKTHLRKELVCANKESGLDNFIGFSARAALFTKKIETICNTSSVQTSIRQNHNDYVETRVTSNALGLTEGEYWKGVFSRNVFIEEEEMRERLTFVIQLTKGAQSADEHNGGRYHKKREQMHKEYNKVACYIESGKSAHKIVGFDVGGLELYFRPEVFAHTLRAAKVKGFGLTFHVSEEFYDIVDGMRAIWEIIQFTSSHPVDRLGHCMALGIDLEQYCVNGRKVEAPKQVMLDNIVWLCCYAREQRIRIGSSLKRSLRNLAEELYEQIGYGQYLAGLNMGDYYASMLLRSDEECAEDGLDIWSETARLNSAQANKARKNENAVKLNLAYRNEDIVKAGDLSESRTMEGGYYVLADKVQQKMIEMVRKKNICIEGCPSSNLQICELESYEQHPAIRHFIKKSPYLLWPLIKRPELKLSVCTDDKGTFSTSLVNEFSLLAAAATNGGAWNKNVEMKFRNLISNGKDSRFTQSNERWRQ